MGELLYNSKSSYFPSFEQIQNDVRNALDEAQDIDTHLRPLSSHFETIETTDFPEAKVLFKPMFHVIGLVYRNCSHYGNAARIVVLLQEISNLIMKQAGEFLEPMELFKGEVDEALIKIEQTFEGLDAFYAEYESIRKEMDSLWDFASVLVFAKWTEFYRRMKMIRDLFSTANTFLKLEKVEIGGVKGFTRDKNSSLVRRFCFSAFRSRFVRRNVSNSRRIQTRIRTFQQQNLQPVGSEKSGPLTTSTFFFRFVVKTQKKRFCFSSLIRLR